MTMIKNASSFYNHMVLSRAFDISRRMEKAYNSAWSSKACWCFELFFFFSFFLHAVVRTSRLAYYSKFQLKQCTRAVQNMSPNNDATRDDEIYKAWNANDSLFCAASNSIVANEFVGLLWKKPPFCCHCRENVLHEKFRKYLSLST